MNTSRSQVPAIISYIYQKRPTCNTVVLLDLQMKGGKYAPGYNTDAGDGWMSIFLKFWEYDQLGFQGRLGTMPGGGSRGNWEVSLEEAAKRRKENEDSLENGKFGKWM